MGMMIRAGVSEKKIQENIVADVVQNMVTPIEMYAIYQIASSEQVKAEWKILKKAMILKRIGWITESRRQRLNTVLKLQNLEEIIAQRLCGM